MGLAGRLFGAGAYRPDDLMDALLPYVDDPRYGIAGFYINTFNQVSTAQAWLEKRGLSQISVTPVQLEGGDVRRRPSGGSRTTDATMMKI